MERICCGFGHREIYESISDALEKEIENAISSGITVFYTGGMGHFDAKFSGAVHNAKKIHPEIKLFLIRPYFSETFNKQKDNFLDLYDGIIIPESAQTVHYKAAITKRNRFMVDKSERVIGFVKRDWGGAFDALKYAKKCKKQVINIAISENK